jgi:putative membrane protein
MRSLKLAVPELSRLVSRPLLRVALVVLMLVPLLYGALYLWAFWNPYGNLGHIPVALVNLDHPVASGDSTISAGADLVEGLLKSKTLGWHLVGPQEAARGLADGTYYSSLTIPAGFSAALASADASSPAQARLQVSIHESKSMIAGQIESSVFREVRKTASVSASKSYYDRIFVSYSQVHNGMESAARGATRLSSGLEDASSGAVALQHGAASADAGGESLARGIGALNAGAARLSEGIGKLSEGSTSLADGAAALDSGATSVAQGAQKLAAGASALSTGTLTLQTGAKTLASSAEQVSGGAAHLNAGVADANRRVTAAADAASRLSAGASQVTSSLNSYAAAHPEALADPAFASAVQAATGVSANADGLATGLNASRISATQLAAGSDSLAAGAARLSAGISRLASGAGDTAAGASALAHGADALSAGAAKAADGARQLHAGASSLSAGASAVAQGASSLKAGLTRANAGATTLATGLARLNGGSLALARGIKRAQNGSLTLSDSLSEGAAKVPAYDSVARADHAGMMSDPVALDTRKTGRVTNYGTGFAPYFVPLALWVGALLVFMIVAPLPETAVRSGARGVFVALAGLWPGVLLATGQSVLMYVVLRGALGLHPVNPVAFFGMVIVTAIVSSAILQWLGSSFGAVGKLLGIVALMLQLTSAAGTFPIETLPHFFQAISPWLPMTYAVDGLREAISGGNMTTMTRDIVSLLAFGVAAFAGTSLTVRRARKWTSERLKPAFELA